MYICLWVPKLQLWPLNLNLKLRRPLFLGNRYKIAFDITNSKQNPLVLKEYSWSTSVSQ